MPRLNKKPNKTKSPVGWKKSRGNYTYYFKDSVAKQYQIKTIEFIGFSHQPVGLTLYKTGGGFNFRQSNKVGGSQFLGFLENKYKRPIYITVYQSDDEPNTFRVLKRSVSIKISFQHFMEILKDLGDEVRDKRDEVVQKRIASIFPNAFSGDSTEEKNAAVPLSEINLNSLKESDHESIADFIKKYISLNSENDKVLEKLQTNLVIQGRKKTLDQVIKKFEKHMKDKAFDEKDWQKFLHEEVFFFITNYIESIRESNVNFGKDEEGEKKPDFVWIDIYGFLDVFEIKTPGTDILAKRIDMSHKNYYFSSSASKAISQIEKYILFLEKNVEGFERYLSKQTKIPFSVLKPKAFLIIGNSKELESNANKKRDFRLLRRLFKNIEFITFDELLDNLRNLANKFEKAEINK